MDVDGVVKILYPFHGAIFLDFLTVNRKMSCQVLPFVTLLGVLFVTFSGLSDLHLGYQKVTWKKQVYKM